MLRADTGVSNLRTASFGLKKIFKMSVFPQDIFKPMWNKFM